MRTYTCASPRHRTRPTAKQPHAKAWASPSGWRDTLTRPPHRRGKKKSTCLFDLVLTKSNAVLDWSHEHDGGHEDGEASAKPDSSSPVHLLRSAVQAGCEPDSSPTRVRREGFRLDCYLCSVRSGTGVDCRSSLDGEVVVMSTTERTTMNYSLGGSKFAAHWSGSYTARPGLLGRARRRGDVTLTQPQRDALIAVAKCYPNSRSGAGFSSGALVALRRRGLIRSEYIALTESTWWTATESGLAECQTKLDHP